MKSTGAGTKPAHSTGGAGEGEGLRGRADRSFDRIKQIGKKETKKEDGYYLSISLDPGWRNERKRNTVTTKLLGKAIVPDLPYVQPDDSPYRIDTDYFGNKRKSENPHPGPFTALKEGKQTIKV